jgi:DNA-directed RNA polymerase specialized sigma24 family protein
MPIPWTLQNGRSHPIYATCSDFCSYFLNHLQGLYLLAFLLTGSHAHAEECLGITMEECAAEATVFKGWECTWSRRRFVINATHLVLRGRCERTGKSDSWELGADSRRRQAISAVTNLEPPILRFVFVMCVLERYSVHECALLLERSPREAIRLRIRAFRQLSRSSSDRETPEQNVISARHRPEPIVSESLGRLPGLSSLR